MKRLTRRRWMRIWPTFALCASLTPTVVAQSWPSNAEFCGAWAKHAVCASWRPHESQAACELERTGCVYTPGDWQSGNVAECNLADATVAATFGSYVSALQSYLSSAQSDCVQTFYGQAACDPSTTNCFWRFNSPERTGGFCAMKSSVAEQMLTEVSAPPGIVAYDFAGDSTHYPGRHEAVCSAHHGDESACDETPGCVYSSNRYCVTPTLYALWVVLDACDDDITSAEADAIAREVGFPGGWVEFRAYMNSHGSSWGGGISAWPTNAEFCAPWAKHAVCASWRPHESRAACEEARSGCMYTPGDSSLQQYEPGYHPTCTLADATNAATFEGYKNGLSRYWWQSSDSAQSVCSNSHNQVACDTDTTDCFWMTDPGSDYGLCQLKSAVAGNTLTSSGAPPGIVAYDFVDDYGGRHNMDCMLFSDEMHACETAIGCEFHNYNGTTYCWSSEWYRAWVVLDACEQDIEASDADAVAVASGAWGGMTQLTAKANNIPYWPTNAQFCERWAEELLCWGGSDESSCASLQCTWDPIQMRCTDNDETFFDIMQEVYETTQKSDVCGGVDASDASTCVAQGDGDECVYVTVPPDAPRCDKSITAKLSSLQSASAPSSVQSYVTINSTYTHICNPIQDEATCDATDGCSWLAPSSEGSSCFNDVAYQLFQVAAACESAPNVDFDAVAVANGFADMADVRYRAGVTCAANERVSSSNECVACPPGSTNAAGDDASGAETFCGCAENEHVLANECVGCPSGETRSAGDRVPGPDTTCSAFACAANERVSSSNACVPCEGGSTNAADDDASGAETFCECTENERVVANECVACPPGERRAGGDPVPGPDTACSASVCVANERVFNHTCVSCPDGSVNAAGDDASGGDTSCACVENRRVADTGTCEECPEGTVRAAGDRISDGETACDVVCVFARPENGGRGTCEDTLAAGSSCSPECYDGFVSSGDTTCDENGQMTATTCEPPNIEETPAQRSARESKAKAQASRDEMLDGITDPKARKKAKILADAAIAGVPVKKLRLPMTASSADEACDDALETMQIDENLASCEADANGRRRLAASYSVSVYVNPEEVSETALQEAIDNLDAAGIAAFTSDEDPVAVLKEVPGVDASALSAFEADADAAVEAEAVVEAEEAESEAEDEEAGAVPPPPEPPPGPVILVDDEYASARQRKWFTVSALVVSLVVALWL